MVISKIEDGMVAELAKLKPITQDQPLTVDWLLADRKVNPSNLGKLVHAMQIEHAEQAAQPSALKLLSFHGKDTVTFDVVDQTPAADGTYTPYARVGLEKDSKGKWQLDRFITARDPSGIDDPANKASAEYLDISPYIKEFFKSDGNDVRFVSRFITEIAKGHQLWPALMNADDIYGKLYKVLEVASKDKTDAKAIQKTHDGRIPGTFEFHSGGENKADNRVSVAPINKLTK